MITCGLPARAGRAMIRANDEHVMAEGRDAHLRRAPGRAARHGGLPGHQGPAARRCRRRRWWACSASRATSPSATPPSSSCASCRWRSSKAPNGILITDHQRARIEYVNDAYVQHERPCARGPARPGAARCFGRRCPLEPAVGVEAEGRASRWGRDAHWQGQLDSTRKDGSAFTERVHVAPIRQADGIDHALPGHRSRT